MKPTLCHCGKPLHYNNPIIQAAMENMVAKFGENVKITVDGKTYLVQRHYIALHGIKGGELPTLGFKEV